MEGPENDEYTILFADIAGSTRLYEKLGDEAAKTIVTRLQGVIVDLALEAGGRVQEIVGDEVMLCFARTGPAAACAIEIQRELAKLSEDPNALPAVRIGLHCGHAIVEGDRMFGDTINVAARMTAIAQGGQIITTQAVVDRLPDALRSITRRFDVAPLKGKSQPLVVYDLAWQPLDLTEISAITPTAAPTTLLTLMHAGQQFMLTQQQTGFSIGRAPAGDLVVNWPSVSRRHAAIEFARGRFVLSDSSSNGTYLMLQNGQVVFLRRESVPLWGKGRIALGAPLHAGSGHSIGYCCS